MESLAETDRIALQDDRQEGIECEEETADASPSSSEGDEESSPSVDKQPLSYTLLNLAEQHAWDDIMGQLGILEEEAAAVAASLNMMQQEEALRRERSAEELLRQIQGLCEQIEVHPRLSKVHSKQTPCLLQRLCLGKYSVLCRLSEDENHEDDALGAIVKRLIDLNPEALLWTKLLYPRNDEPIVKDIVKKFPKIGRFIFEQHRPIFDSECEGEPVANIVTGLLCRFGCTTTIFEFLHSFPLGLFCQYQSQYPIQVINRRVCLRIFPAIWGGRPVIEESHFEMAFLLVILLKADEGRVFQQPQPIEHREAAFGLMWTGRFCPLEKWVGVFLKAVTTMLMEPTVSNPTVNFNEFASASMLQNFIISATEQSRGSRTLNSLEDLAPCSSSSRLCYAWFE